MNRKRKVSFVGYHCKRCDHNWLPRQRGNKNEDVPNICPSCKSNLWDVRKKPKRVKVNHADILAHAQQIAESNQNTEDSLVEK